MKITKKSLNPSVLARRLIAGVKTSTKKVTQKVTKKVTDLTNKTSAPAPLPVIPPIPAVQTTKDIAPLSPLIVFALGLVVGLICSRI